MAEIVIDESRVGDVAGKVAIVTGQIYKWMYIAVCPSADGIQVVRVVSAKLLSMSFSSVVSQSSSAT
jgi:hypothetical protein